MASPPDPQPARHEGAIGALADLSGKLVNALPPAFLMLVILNAVFLAMVLWFLNHQADQRTALVDKLLDRCMSIALQAQPLPR